MNESHSGAERLAEALQLKNLGSLGNGRQRALSHLPKIKVGKPSGTNVCGRDGSVPE